MQCRSLLALPTLLAAAPAGEVDALLVLAVDASGSIDPDEFRLQREGYAEALSHPAVLAAIAGKPRGAIAVAMVEWGSPGGAATVVDWMRVGDAAAARALAVAAAGQVTRLGEPLAETYRREVIGGPGAFVVTAEDRRDIARALRAKLVREIA